MGELLRRIFDVAGLRGYDGGVVDGSGTFGFDAADNPWDLDADPCHPGTGGCIRQDRMRAHLLADGKADVGCFVFARKAILLQSDEKSLKKWRMVVGWEEKLRELRRPATHPKWVRQLKQVVDDGGTCEEVKEWRGKKIHAISTYFGRQKAETKTCRTILNLRRVNTLFNIPWPVNTCAPPAVLQVLRRLFAPLIRAEIEAGRTGELYFLSLDHRHYWTQYENIEFMKSLGGCCFDDPDTGKRRFVRWRNLMMGDSWAATVGQYLGVFIGAFRNEMLELDEKMEVPPQYLMTKDGRGIFLNYYDNVNAVFLDACAREEFTKRIAQNMEYFNVRLKHAFWNGCEVTWKAGSQWHVADYNQIHITLEVRDRDEDTPLPEILGLEYLADGGCLDARIKQSKIAVLPKKFVSLPRGTPKECTQILGRLLYRRLLMPPDALGVLLLRIISKVGKFVGGKLERWLDPGFGATLTDDDVKVMELSYAEMIQNDWIRTILHEGKKEVVVACSDACLDMWGYVIYGGWEPDQLPKTVRDDPLPRLVQDNGSFVVVAQNNKKGKAKGTLFVLVWKERVIYLKELYAAIKTVKRILVDKENVEILLGVDASAVRVGLNRGVTTNEVGGEMIAELLLLLQKKNSSLYAAKVAGHANWADWKSRGMKLPRGGVHKPPPAKHPEYPSDFSPKEETWRQVLDDYHGRLHKMQGEDFKERRTGAGHLHVWKEGMEEEVPAEVSVLHKHLENLEVAVEQEEALLVQEEVEPVVDTTPCRRGKSDRRVE